jgi:hypothetical protein
MSTGPSTDWKMALGVKGWEPPTFFSRKEDIDGARQPVPQAHALRRAFDGMHLDGVLCLHKTPVVYFKEVRRIEPAALEQLHRHFWNQGLAPILALISPKEVFIYSGLATPPQSGEELNAGQRLVQTLDRVADAAELRQFVLALESGEYFHAHARSFNPKLRVDRELLRNLDATREQLAEVSGGRLDPRMLDALLCRVVFSCYLFDRGIIGRSYLDSLGIKDAGSNLRELLDRPADEARTALYALFARLGEDFNGDLFNDDLAREARHTSGDHLETLARFLRGADVRTGQGVFWPYDFSVIPIETISAIYEHFLKSADPTAKKQSGAFYTPRFLAEVILDVALEGVGSLLDKRFLDPACGSGIFLVGLFNRLAEEWQRKHSGARYDRRASELMAILRDNLFGVDQNPTACRIAAFSLYLAFLDQLKPSDIQALQRKKKFLPQLVFGTKRRLDGEEGRTIFCGDFFASDGSVSTESFDVVVGNPPWTSVSGPQSAAESWCAKLGRPLANRQLALAFIWKAPTHLRDRGRVCFVLPHGVLFNHQERARQFQQAWLEQHKVDLVLNLADFQRFLFEAAEAPALVVRYGKEPPVKGSGRIQYLTPKTDWNVSQAEIISVAAEDRAEIALSEVLTGLREMHAPLVWKERFWGTPRDLKLLDRLLSFPSLRNVGRQSRERNTKPWIVAQGFQPVGRGDDPEKAKRLACSARLFVKARHPNLDLILLESDCEPIRVDQLIVRDGSNTNTAIFRAPHVLVTKGLRAGYADFDVLFRHALQGIHGPVEDRNLLMFLTAYLGTPLARYLLFHASSSWGVSRSEVHLTELLELPFPLPEQTSVPEQCRAIIEEVAAHVRRATKDAQQPLADREGIVRKVQEEMLPLIYGYFDVDEVERVLIEDTNNVIIPSTRPSRASDAIPTLRASNTADREEYTALLCATLNDWARGGPYQVTGRVLVAASSGVGVIVLKRHRGDTGSAHLDDGSDRLLLILERLRKTLRQELGSVEIARGVKVFDRDTLYILKPLGRRYWTRTAALNDADEIAATILSRSARGHT